MKGNKLLLAVLWESIHLSDLLINDNTPLAIFEILKCGSEKALVSLFRYYAIILFCAVSGSFLKIPLHSW